MTFKKSSKNSLPTPTSSLFLLDTLLEISNPLHFATFWRPHPPVLNKGREFTRAFFSGRTRGNPLTIRNTDLYSHASQLFYLKKVNFVIFMQVLVILFKKCQAICRTLMENPVQCRKHYGGT